MVYLQLRAVKFVDWLCQRSMSELIPLIGGILTNQGDGLAYYRAEGG